MNCGQILKLIKDEYPSLQMTHSNKIHVGKALKELGFDSTERSHVPYYKVIPLK